MRSRWPSRRRREPSEARIQTMPHNVEGFRRSARRRVPRAVFDYVDGGAEDEVPMGRNEAAFDALRLVPRVAEEVGPVDMRTTLAGQPLSMPIMLSPAGNVGM